MKYLIFFLILLSFGCIEDPRRKAAGSPSTTKTAIIYNNCKFSVVYSTIYNDGYSRTFSHANSEPIDFQNVNNRTLIPEQEDIFMWNDAVLLTDIQTLYSNDTLHFTVKLSNGKKHSYDESALLNRKGYSDGVIRSWLTFDGVAGLYIEICPKDAK